MFHLNIAATIDSPQPPSAPREKVTQQRLHAFDNLRAFAMLMGVTLHALIPFVTHPGAERWVIVNEIRHPLFDLLVGIIHSFRMQLFFVIAGFFARLLWERRGGREFLRNRAIRIGVPFVVGMLTLAPLIWWQWGWELRFGATTHLWFLQYLLVYYLLAGVAQKLGKYCTFQAVARGSRWLISSPWRALIWMLPTFALIWWWPIWEEAEFGRGQTFLPHPAILAHYALFFAFGWLLHRWQEVIPIFPRRTVLHLTLAFLCLAVWAVAMKMEQAQPESLPPWLKVLSSLAGASLIWFFVFGFIGFFLRYLNSATRTGRYLADGSYWMYLVHLPLVIALQQWLVPKDISPWTKAILINLLAFALLLTSYQFLVRHTFIGAALNGRRA